MQFLFAAAAAAARPLAGRICCGRQNMGNSSDSQDDIARALIRSEIPCKPVATENTSLEVDLQIRLTRATLQHRARAAFRGLSVRIGL